MLIKSLVLNNIRSYTSKKLEFPASSTLLSGDIGAGKTTILLAIEFALFGLPKSRTSHLTGKSLLRNACDKGSVELSFKIDNNNITIKRTLQRKKDTVVQDSGFIIINDSSIRATPIELKSKILELLGYPKSLLKKNDLIFKYTVYTPQGEMKQILQADSALRLDLLRKIFNIDKYQKIKDNCSLFLRYLKIKEASLIGATSNIEEERENVSKKQQELSDYLLKIENLKKELDSLTEKLTGVKNKKDKLKSDVDQYYKLNKKLHGIVVLLEEKKKNLLNIKDKLNQSLSSLKQFNQSLSSLKQPEATHQDRSKEIEQLEEQKANLNSKIYELKTNINNSNNTIKKVTSLNKCPTCLQEVGEHYKKEIMQNQQKLIDDNSKELNQLSLKLEKATNKLLALKEKQEQANKLKIELQSFRIKKNSLGERIKEKNKEIDDEKVKLANVEQEIKVIEANKTETERQLKEFEYAEKLYNQSKREYEVLIKEKHQIEIESAALNKAKQATFNQIEEIKKSIAEKEKLLKHLSDNRLLQNWLNKCFISLLDIIEQQVMYNIRQRFNELLKEWFTMLVEGDFDINVDQNFTPIIEQNNHITDYLHLSGGEKTAVALSYRLAINRILNEMIKEIKTKNLLILDEPTDGFSSQQLDKIKEVLDNLELGQLLIVSHEPKIESFVENVVRFYKENNITQIKT